MKNLLRINQNRTNQMIFALSFIFMCCIPVTCYPCLSLSTPPPISWINTFFIRFYVLHSCRFLSLHLSVLPHLLLLHNIFCLLFFVLHYYRFLYSSFILSWSHFEEMFFRVAFLSFLFIFYLILPTSRIILPPFMRVSFLSFLLFLTSSPSPELIHFIFWSTQHSTQFLPVDYSTYIYLLKSLNYKVINFLQ